MLFSDNPDKLGTKLGPKLVHVISETIAATKLKLLDTEHRARVHSMQTIIDRAGAEIADLYRPVWEDAAQGIDMPDNIREHMDKIMSGRHQWQAIAGAALGYAGAGSSLSTIISNYLAPVVRTAVARSPQLLPPPEALVQLGVRGAMDWGSVYDYSHGAGYADFTLDAMKIAAYSWPDITTTLELLRRNVISFADANKYLERSGIAPETIGQLLALQYVLVSPADLADMVVRGIKTEGDATTEAARSGVHPKDFHELTLLTGEPPGLQQLLEGYRRGFIDKATLEKGIRESRYRNEWIPLLEQLRFSPMSVADAVNAVVQNHITPAQGERISQLNGLEPGQFAILQETAGEPLSRTEMSELVNRGEATEAEFVQAMRESRVKDKYIPHAFQLRRHVIPIFTLERAITAGAVDHATAVAIAMESGYSKRDAEIITHAGSSTKIDPYKKEVVTAVAAAYSEDTIPRDEALGLIEKMGFAVTEATFILDAAEFKRSARIINQVVTAVRSKYISRHIPRTQAGNDLDAIGIPATQRDFMLSLWDIELEANTRHLTEAQVVKAVHKSLITEADGVSRLVAMGYNEIDANLLLKGA
jgi:hypothetical protein